MMIVKTPTAIQQKSLAFTTEQLYQSKLHKYIHYKNKAHVTSSEGWENISIGQRRIQQLHIKATSSCNELHFYLYVCTPWTHIITFALDKKGFVTLNLL
jgi:hypothetical protein